MLVVGPSPGKGRGSARRLADPERRDHRGSPLAIVVPAAEIEHLERTVLQETTTSSGGPRKTTPRSCSASWALCNHSTGRMRCSCRRPTPGRSGPGRAPRHRDRRCGLIRTTTATPPATSASGSTPSPEPSGLAGDRLVEVDAGGAHGGADRPDGRRVQSIPRRPGCGSRPSWTPPGRGAAWPSPLFFRGTLLLHGAPPHWLIGRGRGR